MFRPRAWLRALRRRIGLILTPTKPIARPRPRTVLGCERVEDRLVPSPVAPDYAVTTTVNQPVAITVSPSDPDEPGQAVPWGVMSWPGHGTVSWVDGQFTYTPDAGYGGTDQFQYYAEDDLGYASGTVTVTVTQPVVTVSLLGDPAEGGADGAVEFDRTGDTGQPLTVSYSAGGTAVPGVNYQALSGSVTIPAGSAAAQVPISAIEDNTYNPGLTVTVTAQDDEGGGYTVASPGGTVTATIAEGSPAIVQQNVEGDSVSVQSQVDAPEGASLTYSATDLPAGLNIDPATGLITGTIAAGAATVGDDGWGDYAVTVTATDGVSAETEAIAWSVSPRITVQAGDQQSVEGNNVSLQVQAGTPDATALTYSATNLPAGLNIDPASGVISGTVAVGDSAAGDDGEGDYAIAVSVTDGTYTGATTFYWSVSSPVTVQVADQQNVEGDSVNLPVQVSAPTGAPLTYSATNLPAGLSIDAATGVISGTVAAGAATGGDDDLGDYTVTISATDGTYTGIATVYWSVSPRITISVPDVQGNAEGDSVSEQAQVGAPTGTTLTYSAADLPAGLSIDPATGIISGTVAAGAATAGDDGDGVYGVTVTATDGTYTATEAIYWAVLPQGTTPVSTTVPDSGKPGDPIDVIGGTLQAKVSKTDLGVGMFSLTYTGANPKDFQVSQWMQLEVYHQDAYRVGGENRFKDWQLYTTVGVNLDPPPTPGDPPHDHDHVTAVPMNPTLQVDNGGSKTPFSAGPYDDTSQAGKARIYSDAPTTPKALIPGAQKLWKDQQYRGADGTVYTICSIRVVERFITTAYVKGVAVQSYHWTSTSEASWDGTGSVPVVALLGRSPPNVKPADIIKQWWQDQQLE